MAVINQDTIWVVDDNSFNGGIYRTANGGNTWQLQQAFTAANPNKIYMYNSRIGFACDNFRLYKTTNSGENWLQISGSGQGNRFFDIYFVDSLTGWKTAGDTMKFTSNGGFNWTNQILPHGGMLYPYMSKFKNLNSDTIWGSGGSILYPNNQVRGLLYKTTNRGINWLFQVPDTSIHIGSYPFIDFVYNKYGWAYQNYTTYVTGIHTTTGGDTTFYTGIQQTPYSVPEGFVLKQNYPNPFNPRTVIPYSLSAPAHVKIIAYDITGREIQRMVDSYQQAGAYEVDFMGKFTASGVYFYRMTVDDKVVGTRKMMLIK